MIKSIPDFSLLTSFHSSTLFTLFIVPNFVGLNTVSTGQFKETNSLDEAQRLTNQNYVDYKTKGGHFACLQTPKQGLAVRLAQECLLDSDYTSWNSCLKELLTFQNWTRGAMLLWKEGEDYLLSFSDMVYPGFVIDQNALYKGAESFKQHGNWYIPKKEAQDYVRENNLHVQRYPASALETGLLSYPLDITFGNTVFDDVFKDGMLMLPEYLERQGYSVLSAELPKVQDVKEDHALVGVILLNPQEKDKPYFRIAKPVSCTNLGMCSDTNAYPVSAVSEGVVRLRGDSFYIDTERR